MSRVHVLPDHMINQIAAGEVIERPASVVKELFENALDAGARSIAVDVEGGGRRRIRVADDGEGLDRDDALLALERHATSKLSSIADLARIGTLGFRGEALPAIAAVSRLVLQSSRDGLSGTRVEVDGGRIREVVDAGHPKGTTIEVRDLFFNTPARAKFLRSPSTEMGHISDLVSSYAVSNPGLNVKLTHEGRDLLEAPPADDLAGRVRRLHGRDWGEAIPIESERGGLRVRGLIAPPARSAASRRMQHLYVNGRLVRDKLISHAVASACESLIPKGRHAAIFLFLSCPLDAVDVNVHPAKAEVRFRDSHAVHDLVRQAVENALRGGLPITPLGQTAATGGQEDATAIVAEASSTRASHAVHEAARRYLESADAGQARMAERGGGLSERLSRERGGALVGGAVALAHYRESYIVAADEEGLLLIDQHAAHERILYERLLESGQSEARQALMFPVAAAVPRSLGLRLDETAQHLAALGILAEPFGQDTLLVRETPSSLGTVDLPGLLTDLLDLMAEDSPLADAAGVLRREKLLATMACHAAIKVHTPLTGEKMNYLIKELFRTASPLKCPHGRPAVLRYSHEAIERGFERR